MKIKNAQFIAAALAAAFTLTNAHAQKMKTDIPNSITTPDSVKTRIGTLKLFDGFPDDATVQKVYDNLDFQRGVQAFLTAMPGRVGLCASRGVQKPGRGQPDGAHHGDADGLEVTLPHGELRDRL